MPGLASVCKRYLNVCTLVLGQLIWQLCWLLFDTWAGSIHSRDTLDRGGDSPPVWQGSTRFYYATKNKVYLKFMNESLIFSFDMFFIFHLFLTVLHMSKHTSPIPTPSSSLPLWPPGSPTHPPFSMFSPFLIFRAHYSDWCCLPAHCWLDFMHTTISAVSLQGQWLRSAQKMTPRSILSQPSALTFFPPSLLWSQSLRGMDTDVLFKVEHPIVIYPQHFRSSWASAEVNAACCRRSSSSQDREQPWPMNISINI